MAYGFARWIEKQAQYNHTPNILFAARDGYTLKRVFDTFPNTDFSTAYVYALRFLNRICRLDYNKQSLEQALAVITHFTQKSPTLAKQTPRAFSSAQQAQAFIQDHFDIISAMAQQELNNYRQYILLHTPREGQVGIVDSVTYSFSAQKLIETCIGKDKVCGYYWSVLPSGMSDAHHFEHFLPMSDHIEDHRSFTHHWDFMEFLFTAPQPPIKNITADGHPIHAASIPTQEQDRIKAYQKLSDGCVYFASEVRRIFGTHDIFLFNTFCLNWVNWFLLHPNKQDTQEMAHIFHASDTSHREYVPLFSYHPTLAEIFKNPKQYISFTKQAYWKTPFQFVLTHLLSPVSVEKLNGTKWGICFFPRARKQYARLGISFGKKWYGLSWGRRKD